MITILLGFLIWAALHSFTAGRAKPIVRQRFGERAYRLVSLRLQRVCRHHNCADLWLVYEHRTVIWAIPSQWIPVSVTVEIVGVVGFVAAMIRSTGTLQDEPVARISPERHCRLRRAAPGGLWGWCAILCIFLTAGNPTSRS
jgi:hypothetical protein